MIKLSQEELREKEIKLQKNLNEYRDKITDILGAKLAREFCNALIAHEFTKRVLAGCEAQVKKLENEIEKTVAKQYPKETDYNAIGVVEQFKTSLRKHIEEKNHTQKGFAMSRVKLCEKSLQEHLGVDLTKKIVSLAIVCEANENQVEKLKQCRDREIETLKAYTTNAAAKIMGTRYTKAYYDLDDVRKAQMQIKEKETGKGM